MIRWCSYCQSYISEVEPLLDFSFTHAICENCMQSTAFRDAGKMAKARLLQGIYETLQYAVQRREINPFREAYAKLKDLDIKPVDLVLGIVQPLLYEVGEQWLQGKITVADEHYYSAISSGVLQMIHSSLPESQYLRQNNQPVVLLMLPSGNAHTIGLDIVEMILMLQGVASFKLARGDNEAELAKMLKVFSPRYVGVSVTLASQLERLSHIVEIVDDANLNPRPEILAGGLAFRRGAAEIRIPGVRIFPGVSEMLGYIQ